MHLFHSVNFKNIQSGIFQTLVEHIWTGDQVGKAVKAQIQ